MKKKAESKMPFCSVSFLGERVPVGKSIKART